MKGYGGDNATPQWCQNPQHMWAGKAWAPKPEVAGKKGNKLEINYKPKPLIDRNPLKALKLIALELLAQKPNPAQISLGWDGRDGKK